MKIKRVITAGWLFGSIVFWMLAVNANKAMSYQPMQIASPNNVEVSPEWNSGTPAAEVVQSGWLPEVTTFQVTQFCLIMAALLITYSLLTAGKRGKGWWVLSILLMTVSLFAKCFLSMFMEVTTQYCPPDWDED